MGNPSSVRESLRQMLALLEGERQALAALDLERIITCADGKLQMCAAIEGGDLAIDEETRGLLDAVKRMNEVNKKLRNLIAANVQARLSALSGQSSLYSAGRSPLGREFSASA